MIQIVELPFGDELFHAQTQFIDYLL